MSAKRQASRPPTVIERFIKALVVTYKAVLLYPPTSNIPKDTARDAIVALNDAIEARPEVRMVVNKNGLFYDDVPIFPDHPAYTLFAKDLYNRHVADVRFHSGTSERDLALFLGLLKYSPAELEASGGFESRLWDLGVSSVTVTEIAVTVLEGGTLEGEGAARLSRQEIDEALTAAYAGRGREQLVIARFISDSGQVAQYLAETAAASGDDMKRVGDRFAELAQVAHEMSGDLDRLQLLSSLSDALEQLEPSLRRRILVDDILPEARTNDSLASVIRQLDIDEVCHLLVEDIDLGEVSRDGLARAIRNLAFISLADRQEVMSSAGAAMLGAGMAEATVNEVLEMASPSRVEVRGGPQARDAEERPVDTIFKLMDLAPAGHEVDVTDDDPGMAALKGEARRGITDGDVIMALVSLVGMDPREAQFASTMAMIEDSLDLLIDRGELDIAADSADALRAAAEDHALSEEQRSRLRRAVSYFSKPGDIRNIAHALRLYRPESVEHNAARRLMAALGTSALEPLIEQLADEADMAVRKSLVDLLAEMAPQHISEVGAFVSDNRWYVVRNVVSVLGTTHSSAALPYLERTVRHPEARVRRETIRALASINDRLAQEMLIGALGDENGQNVQLAARYLGAGGATGAVRALEQVARGEGRGNRDAGPRVEAIEALGRIGSREAMPTLEALAGKRSLIGASKARELRSAAESAIARIRATEVNR